MQPYASGLGGGLGGGEGGSSRDLAAIMSSVCSVLCTRGSKQVRRRLPRQESTRLGQEGMVGDEGKYIGNILGKTVAVYRNAWGWQVKRKETSLLGTSS